MPVLWIFLFVAGLAVIGFVLGRARALSSADGDVRHLHSLPFYYGANAALKTFVPAALVLAVWSVAQPLVLDRQVSSMIPQSVIDEGGSLGLVMGDVSRVASGLDQAVEQGAMTADEATNLRSEFTDVRARLGELGIALGADVKPEVLKAAQALRIKQNTAAWVSTFVVIALAIAGFGWAISQTNKDFRARTVVEGGTKSLLILSASLAVLTTVGIILSLVFNTIEFFKLYSPADFFFGTTWSPSFTGTSQLGILPLLWGTMYISIIALIVAVPIGLFAAVYLSEYAGPKTRAFAKPLIEILAGIPTIVYGLFALLTVGPLLVDIFGDGGTLGVSWMKGGTAVMTAGLVMGIMLIPFVSSLSDDIINAVPQSLRDGSFGLGATKSETIRQVVLPAALPGIVGAILLAASRAIGETMIVVLGAGAAGKLDMNPFEAMTTVTAKIVSQLTGDGDFASPEALVAFALGMTLFVITLGLNFVALYIVRKYREQYD